jgi:ComF family protein
LTLGESAWVHARRLGEEVLSLLAPLECASCSSGIEGGVFCETCALGLCECDPAVCAACPAPVAARGLCHACRARLAPLDGVVCAYEYASPLSETIAKMKYEGHDELAEPLGSCLQSGLRNRLMPSPDTLLLAVPLHDRRLRARGFDQGWLLTRGFRSALPRPRPIALARLLQRTRDTTPQVGLGRRARERNLAGAFRVESGSSGARISGRDVVLIDDVLTTGATLRAAAEALHDAGARTVLGVTLARALT